MKLTSYDVQTFAREQLNTFKLCSFSLNKENALRELSNEIASEWDELNGLDVMQSRCDHFNVPKTRPSDYSEKLLELKRKRKAIYGIRHMGGDREVPFIHLRPNFEIRSQEDALKVYEHFKHELSAFKPLYLCFWSDQKIEADFIGSTYLVTTAKKVKALPAWKNEELLEFQRVSDNSYYEWYKMGYDKFHEERPELKKNVVLNSLDSMEDSKKQGLLYVVSLKGERIGLISGERDSFLGHQGIYFHEIFLDKKWKGRGLAKAIQRKFVVQNAHENDYIWGTIDDSNIPSYKTALSNGRKPVRFECFFKLDSEAI